MKVALVDYGVGNIFSVAAALTAVGASFTADTDGSRLVTADVALVPGVAAFGPGLERLRASGQADALRAHHALGRPVVGLCLGAQMLLGRSEESPESEGLALVGGDVVRLDAAQGRVPRQGWQWVEGSEPGLGGYFYFSHSYGMRPRATVTATSQIGSETVVAVFRGSGVVGVQFHPERSGPAGLAFLASILGSLE